VLIARGRAVESLAQATHFVFDKTGTLTQGRLKLHQILYLRDSQILDESTICKITANITATSNHPVARALFSSLSVKPSSNESSHFEDTNEIPGKGIEVCHQGIQYRLGSMSFVKELHGASFEIPSALSGMTISALGDAKGFIAIFALEDSLREDANYLIDYLKKQGKSILLLSGDRSDVVNNAANKLGIETALGNLTPSAKYDVVKQLQQQGAIVAMVGDGMNDGPVLSLADISIAMGQGAPISQARSDMVLISNNLRDLSYAIEITLKSLSLIRQNLGWAVMYNVIAIPAAAMGVLAPWHAAIGMSLSSIIVVANSLRIYSITNQRKSAELDPPINQARLLAGEN